MNTPPSISRGFGVAALSVALIIVSGCGLEETTLPPVVGPAKTVSVSSNVKLEVNGDKRRVLINASVSCREGFLEVFLTHKGPQNKGYESVLWADVDARKIHEALLQAKAVPGSPVRFEPDFREPRGQIIKVLVQYEKDGKLQTVPAQSWLRTKSGKEVTLEWAFAGSALVEDEFNPGRPKIYLAQAEGALITAGNLESALLDVNIRSSAQRDEIDLDYFTERIPPIGTKVTVILEPVGEYKKDKK